MPGAPLRRRPEHEQDAVIARLPRRLRADPSGLARRLAWLLGLDPERVLLWLFARCVQQSPSWPWLVAVARQLAPG